MMNSIINTAIEQCYECQEVTKENREEPIQMTDIPRRPWGTISIDQAEPYPDDYYNLIRQEKQIPSARAGTIN